MLLTTTTRYNKKQCDHFKSLGRIVNHGGGNFCDQRPAASDQQFLRVIGEQLATSLVASGIEGCKFSDLKSEQATIYLADGAPLLYNLKKKVNNN